MILSGSDRRLQTFYSLLSTFAESERQNAPWVSPKARGLARSSFFFDVDQMQLAVDPYLDHGSAAVAHIGESVSVIEAVLAFAVPPVFPGFDGSDLTPRSSRLQRRCNVRSQGPSVRRSGIRPISQKIEKLSMRRQRSTGEEQQVSEESHDLASGRADLKPGIALIDLKMPCKHYSCEQTPTLRALGVTSAG